MHNTQLEIEIVRDTSGLDKLRGDWEALFSRAERPHLSQSFEWCWSAWTMIVHPSGGRLHCIIVRSDGRIVLIFPMVIISNHLLWKIAVPLGTHGDYADVLVETLPNRYHLILSAWRAFCKNCCADVIQVDHARIHSALYKVLISEIKQPKRVEPAPYVAWDSYRDWESYWNSRHKSFRTDVGRRHRRLMEVGRVSFEVITGGEKYKELVEWMLVHKDNWVELKKRDRAPWIRSSQYKNFLLLVHERVRSVGELSIFALFLDGNVIAAELNRIDSNRLESIHASYDLNYAKYGPGNILAQKALEWSCNRKLTYDFLFGDNKHKRILCDGSLEVASFHVNLTYWGRVYEQLKAAIGSRPIRFIIKSIRDRR